MAKLIMLSGLPASGKSTRAAAIVKLGGWIRVNRDLLRTMLHFDKWSGRNEGIVIDMEKVIVRAALVSNHNVVVDDTNLGEKNKQMWKSVAEDCGAAFESELIDTRWPLCVSWDAAREKKVGRSVIINMALNAGLYEVPEKGFVISDIDGTICDIKHRLHFVRDLAEGQKKDWKSFFEALPDDVPRQDTIVIIKGYAALGHEIIFVSARPETYRKQTEEWLAKHVSVPYTAIIMRRADDKRPDTEVKQGIYDRYFKDKYPIETIIDDRPAVIRMWRENGLKVIDVGGGVEF